LKASYAADTDHDEDPTNVRWLGPKKTLPTRPAKALATRRLIRAEWAQGALGWPLSTWQRAVDGGSQGFGVEWLLESPVRNAIEERSCLRVKAPAVRKTTRSAMTGAARQSSV